MTKDILQALAQVEAYTSIPLLPRFKCNQSDQIRNFEGDIFVANKIQAVRRAGVWDTEKPDTSNN